MSYQKKIIAWLLIAFGSLAGLLLLPALFSAGDSGSGKILFLVSLIGFSIGCLMSGAVLLAGSQKMRWIPLLFIFLMAVFLGIKIILSLGNPEGRLWLTRNNLLPVILILLAYSEYYLIRNK